MRYGNFFVNLFFRQNRKPPEYQAKAGDNFLRIVAEFTRRRGRFCLTFGAAIPIFSAWKQFDGNQRSYERLNRQIVEIIVIYGNYITIVMTLASCHLIGILSGQSIA